MKKDITLTFNCLAILVLLALLAGGFSACGGGGGLASPVVDTYYTVTFDAGGGDPVPEPIIVQSGSKLTPPEGIKRSKYNLAGWYVDQSFEDQWNFEEDVVTCDITLYASWSASRGGGGGGGGGSGSNSGNNNSSSSSSGNPIPPLPDDFDDFISDTTGGGGTGSTGTFSAESVFFQNLDDDPSYVNDNNALGARAIGSEQGYYGYAENDSRLTNFYAKPGELIEGKWIAGEWKTGSVVPKYVDNVKLVDDLEEDVPEEINLSNEFNVVYFLRSDGMPLGTLIIDLLTYSSSGFIVKLIDRDVNYDYGTISIIYHLEGGGPYGTDYGPYYLTDLTPTAYELDHPGNPAGGGKMNAGFFKITADEIVKLDDPEKFVDDSGGVSCFVDGETIIIKGSDSDPDGTTVGGHEYRNPGGSSATQIFQVCGVGEHTGYYLFEDTTTAYTDLGSSLSDVIDYSGQKYYKVSSSAAPAVQFYQKPGDLANNYTIADFITTNVAPIETILLDAAGDFFKSTGPGTVSRPVEKQVVAYAETAFPISVEIKPLQFEEVGTITVKYLRNGATNNLTYTITYYLTDDFKSRMDNAASSWTYTYKIDGFVTGTSFVPSLPVTGTVPGSTAVTRTINAYAPAPPVYLPEDIVDAITVTTSFEFTAK